MRESAIEKAICRYAKSVGILQFKFTSPNRSGVPDRIFLPPNRQVVYSYGDEDTERADSRRLQENEHPHHPVSMDIVYTWLTRSSRAKEIINSYL